MGDKPGGRAEKPTPAQKFIQAHKEVHGDENGEIPSHNVIAQGGIEGIRKHELSKARNGMSNRVGTRKIGTEGG